VKPLLLDTHAFIWLATEPELLDAKALAQVSKPGAALLLSSASVWEIVIKHGLGRLQLDGDPESFVRRALVDLSLTGLPVEISHTLALAELPLIHRDPFDRVLVAQAQSLGARLVTRDRQIGEYDVEVVWA
jgi:PIN domain nuclease of toxin-antitoxin system